MQVILDIPYGVDPKQRWDLYTGPPSSIGERAGIIVFIHGGAWRSGDKSEHQVLAKDLVAATGFPVAVPNYRLSPRVTQGTSNEETVKHPTHAQDVALALSVIRGSDHLPTGTDVDRLFLIGHSCGAHMISSLLLVPPPIDGDALDKPLASDVYNSVQGVALAEGIYDLELLLETFPDYNDFVQGAFETTTSSLSQFSVNRYGVRGGTIQWLIMHSSGDTLVDMPQAYSMFHHLQSEYSSIGADSSRIRKEFAALTADHDEVLSVPEFINIIKGMI